MNPVADLLACELGALRREAPQVADFLARHGLAGAPDESRLGACLDAFSEADYEDLGVDRDRLLEQLAALCAQSHARAVEGPAIGSITLIGGRDKAGRPEEIRLELRPGEVTSLVGPTGSGKSRLLADIEWLAQGDTPTGRHVLVDGQVPDPEWRFSLERKLVAQLSQNMNFVMDASVADFVAMHAEARGVADAGIVERILAQANDLAGEAFAAATPVTALSGGQSRALMIADTALLSASPVVLIDEIENAGVDRKRALELLVRQEKIVLIATHDPILALRAARRIVIANGGMRRLIETTPAEQATLAALETMDARIAALRQRLRSGEVIEGL
ncbi:ABC-type antimicrobial peptide transport system, ATPase component [Thioflavicoccus mobilis 8321]|uniref:ABC-type antimicrobial peptide transport system, ATPase component n=1 Tax=Thioflavicoccus mobilis 8321 TaxID=765912 RepID=L0GVG7_9GAMM|nr:ATP-binding cassette domain-containing protein [Thioflavicoccus mobilis]AGA90758.1 ABC-type antimicrobial peptide transport system, ATPase component [Thioflavicoccus mobilis 8321]